MAKYIDLESKEGKLTLSLEDIVSLSLQGLTLRICYKHCSECVQFEFETKFCANDVYNAIHDNLTQNE